MPIIDRLRPDLARRHGLITKPTIWPLIAFKPALPRALPLAIGAACPWPSVPRCAVLPALPPPLPAPLMA
jgi:hypothetical protein